MRVTLATTLVFALSTSAAQADLRYTTRMEVRRTPTAVPDTAPELSAVLGALMPSGETRIFMRAQSMRIEQGNGAARTVVLTRPDGQFVLYPASQTYLRMPALRNDAARAQPPAPLFRRTGEFATILGLRAERVLVTMTIAFPGAPPPGVPSSMTLEGELWLTDAYSAEARGLQTLMGAVAPKGGPEGMVLRQVLRNAQMGYEMEMQVTELVEGPLDPALFEIPAGYRRVDELFIPDPPGRGRQRLL